MPRFPCKDRDCERSFGSQDAMDQHYFSFHQKELYDAKIKASQIANQERKKREEEEARRMRAAGVNNPQGNQVGRIESLLWGPNLSYGETILEKNGYHESSRSSGQPLDSAPRFVDRRNKAPDMGPSSRAVPLTPSSSVEERSPHVSGTQFSTTPPTTASEIPPYEYENDRFSYNSESHFDLLPCSECNFLFRDQESLDYHINTKHQPPPCFVCRKPYPQDQDIDEHLEAVPHRCSHCDIVLPSRKTAIKNHMWFTHPLVCQECGWSLPNSNALTRHMSTVHSGGGNPCLACQPPCGQVFGTKEALNEHNKSVRGDSSAVPTRRSGFTYIGAAPQESIPQAQDPRRRTRNESIPAAENPKSRRAARRVEYPSGSKSSFLPLRPKEESTSALSAAKKKRNSSYLPLRPREEENPSVSKKSSVASKRHEEEFEEEEEGGGGGGGWGEGGGRRGEKFELGSRPWLDPSHNKDPPLAENYPGPPIGRRRNSSVAGSSSGSITHHTEISSVSGRFPLVPSTDDNRFRCSCGSNTCVMSCEGPQRTNPPPPTPKKHSIDSSSQSVKRSTPTPSAPVYTARAVSARPIVRSVQPILPAQPLWLETGFDSSSKTQECLIYPCFSCNPVCGNVFDTEEAKDAHIKSLSSTRKPLNTNGNSSGSSGTAEKHSEHLRMNEKSSSPYTKYNKTLFFCHEGDPGCEEIFDTNEALSAHIDRVARLKAQALERDSRSTEKTTPVRHPALLGSHEKTSSPAVRCITTLFSCESCNPTCNEVFNTREGLSSHIEQKARLEIRTLEADIRSTEQTGRLQIQSLERKLEKLKRAHRLEIEAMNINLELALGKLSDIDTQILPSFACNLCKPFCGNIFDTEAAIEEHLDIVFDNAMATRLRSFKEKDSFDIRGMRFPVECYTCEPPCGSSIDSSEGLNQHLDLMIEKSQLLISQYSKREFPCNRCDPCCGNVFNCREDLEAHLKSVTKVIAAEITGPKNSLNLNGEFEDELLVDLESPTFQEERMQEFQQILNSCAERKRQTAELSILDIVDHFSCETCNPKCGRIFNTEEELQIHQEFIEEKNLRGVKTPDMEDQWKWLIKDTPETVETLLSMTHKQEPLLKNGYFESPQRFSHEKTVKCMNCQSKKSKLDLKEDTTCTYHHGRWIRDGDQPRGRPDCCKKRTRGCVVLQRHTYIGTEPLGEPALQVMPTPMPSFLHPKRKAVVLSCGLGVSTRITSELIRLIAIDFFSGEILIDKLIRPTKKIADYKTRWTGVTEEMVQHAIAAGESLDSVEDARAELFKWVDSQTILMGHSINVELWHLQLKHHLFIDTFLSITQATTEKGGDKMKKLKFRNVYREPIRTLRGVRELIIRLSGSGTAILTNRSQDDYEGRVEEEEVSEPS